MVWTVVLGIGAVLGAGLLAWIGWGLYVRWSVETIPCEVVETIGDVEIRQYPDLVTVTTVATDEQTAFRRLVRYLKGANDGGTELAMTAPVAGGEKIEMTAPVATTETGAGTESGDGVRLSFYLPADYDPETAPEPTDDAVSLAPRSARRVAALGFSGRATDRSVQRHTEQLRGTLARHDRTPDGEPVLWRYNDPRTPPFMRRNEVVVPLDE